MAMDFLDHLCERWKIKSEATSWEYWRQYKQLYSSVTGKYVDRNDGREVLKVWLSTRSLTSSLTHMLHSGTMLFWSPSTISAHLILKENLSLVPTIYLHCRLSTSLMIAASSQVNDRE